MARYLIDDIYTDKNIILQPDEDGDWFWEKFSFDDDKESKKRTWRIKSNRR